MCIHSSSSCVGEIVELEAAQSHHRCHVSNKELLSLKLKARLSGLITLTKAEARHYLSTPTPTLRLLPRQRPSCWDETGARLECERRCKSCAEVHF